VLDKHSFVCENALMNTYSVSEFSKIVGVSVKTLQRWDREKKLIPLRSLSNRRVYTEEHLSKAVGITISKKERKVIVYTRVSSQSQKNDLLNQKRMLEQFCSCKGLNVDGWIEEIGGGFKNPDLELSDRIWTCPNCNETHDRDLNAAINIEREAMRLVSS